MVWKKKKSIVYIKPMFTVHGFLQSNVLLCNLFCKSSKAKEMLEGNASNFVTFTHQWHQTIVSYYIFTLYSQNRCWTPAVRTWVCSTHGIVRWTVVGSRWFQMLCLCPETRLNEPSGLWHVCLVKQPIRVTPLTSSLDVLDVLGAFMQHFLCFELSQALSCCNRIY